MKRTQICMNVVLFIALISILIINMNIASHNTEPYCTSPNEVEKMTSPYYQGIQDAILYTNSNISNATLENGLKKVNYDNTDPNVLCKKIGFEQGYSMYQDARITQKSNMNKKVSI